MRISRWQGEGGEKISTWPSKDVHRSSLDGDFALAFSPSPRLRGERLGVCAVVLFTHVCLIRMHASYLCLMRAIQVCKDGRSRASLKLMRMPYFHVISFSLNIVFHGRPERRQVLFDL